MDFLIELDRAYKKTEPYKRGVLMSLARMGRLIKLSFHHPDGDVLDEDVAELTPWCEQIASDFASEFELIHNNYGKLVVGFELEQKRKK